MKEDTFNRESSVPLYRQLADALREQITSGAIEKGQKLPSESEMIKNYDVGRLTVRSALSLLVDEGYLTKSQGKGTFCLGAEPAQENRLDIQVLLDMQDTYFIPYYVRGISEVLSHAGSNFLINDTKDDDNILLRQLEGLARKNISGLILQYTHECLSEATNRKILESIDNLVKRGIPIVILDGKLDNPSVSCLYLDEENGGKRAAEHLAAFGHKKCAVLYREDHRDSRLRRKGFLNGAEIFGMSIPVCINTLGDWESEIVRAVTDGVTGIFAYNDDAALKCVIALKKAGLSIPEDVSVIGFDNSYLASVCMPPLTSLAHPKEKIGTDAAELMLKLLQNPAALPVEKAYKTELIMRNSCGPKKA